MYYCYLGFNKSDNCFDCFNVDNCHKCYELIDSKDCFRVIKSSHCNNSSDLLFCDNCQDCSFCCMPFLLFDYRETCNIYQFAMVLICLR